MTHPDFDIAIVGAGPAGSTLALALAPGGLRIGVFDRSSFPREAICGDALGGQVLRVLQRMPDGLYVDFLSLEPKLPSYGIRFISPGGHVLGLPYPVGAGDLQPAPGYICPRKVFDAFLVSRFQRYGNIMFFPDTPVLKATRQEDHIRLDAPGRSFTATMVTGADGIRSVIRRDLGSPSPEKPGSCVAVRAYFTGVTGFPDPDHQNLLSLYFLREVLPAYLWVFPDAGHGFNVGLGMLYRDLIRKKQSLKQLLGQLIREHPLLVPRFRHAKQITPLKARGLAIQPSFRDLSGDRFLLLGDAARLVDPFTGEGIGEAMASAESAAQVISGCFLTGDFSAGAMQAYDEKISRRMGLEHRTSMTLQRYARHPWLIDHVVRKASQNQEFRDLLAKGYTQEQIRSRLANPLFYLRLAGIR